MSPETLKYEKHDKTVDIWSVGILLFELIHGFAPFSRKGNSREKMLDEMENASKNGISFNSEVTQDARDIIKYILKIDP